MRGAPGERAPPLTSLATRGTPRAALGLVGATLIADVLDRSLPQFALAVAKDSSIHPDPGGAAVARAELDLDVARHALGVLLTVAALAIVGIDVQRRGVDGQQGLPVLEFQHLDHRRVGVENRAARGGPEEADRHVLDETVVALLGGGLRLGAEPGGAQQQGELLADRLQHGDPGEVESLRSLPPDQIERARQVAVDVERHDHARAMREAAEQLEREARVILDAVTRRDGALAERAFAQPLVVDRQDRRRHDRCAVGSWGGQRPGLAPYVAGTGPRTGPLPPEGVHVACPHARADSSACSPALAAIHNHLFLTQLLPRSKSAKPYARELPS